MPLDEPGGAGDSVAGERVAGAGGTVELARSAAGTAVLAEAAVAVLAAVSVVSAAAAVEAVAAARDGNLCA